MNSPHYTPLKIYNASAGSGKTYHLVKEYIQLLISTETGGSTFSNIIAMTFTNKAALEMKERIILALDQVAHPERFARKGDALTEELSSSLGVSPEEIVSRTQKALRLILHHYEDFHVMTIDKFNLRLIKSFGRDLDLPADFEVVMDETSLIEQVVDDLMNQLGSENAGLLNDLMFQYAKSNVEDGNSWNFRRELVLFGKVLNSEKNQPVIERLMTMDFSMEQFGRLHHSKKQLDEASIALAKKIIDQLDSHALSADELPGKSRTMNGILKMANIQQFPLDEKVIGKSVTKAMETELKANQRFPEELKQTIEVFIAYRSEQLEEYASLRLFLSNFFNMALLQFMAQAMQDIKKEERVIRISEFNTLISSLINSEDRNESTPFIYERLGSRFHHFLLDEFQDTSRLQWLNLVPLVHDSIGQNKDNLIVGDPKQSIYRFKNGVAEQFVALPKIFNPEGNSRIQAFSQYFDQMGEVIPLENNWRSSPIIVQLNNSFFESLREQLPEKAKDFYNSVSQFPKSSIHGKIVIQSKEERVTTESIVPQIEDWIKECVADGFKLGDICILGGTNKVCNTWALRLNERGYKVVSTDSLLINSNLKVQLTIAYLKRRLRPSGEHEKKRFAELFFRMQTASYSKYQNYIEEYKTEEGKKYRRFNDAQFLQEHFEGYESFFFKHESIYDLIQSFYQFMKYDELADPYLHHLADIAYEFGLKRGPDLKVFLDDYEVKKNKIAVQVPESDDAVQVMTIHKSKGLEFPVVIMPSLDFGLELKSKFLVENGDYVIYKQPAKSDALDSLLEIYQDEKDQILTDNVNKCYVAMTRPVERLYIQNYFDKAKFGQFFHDVLETLEGVVSDEGELKLLLDDGERTTPDESSDDHSLMHPINLSERLWFPHISLQDKNDLHDEDYLSDQMQFGVQFHLLISRIEQSDQIDSAIDHAIKSGEISEENKSTLKDALLELLNRDDYSELFSGAEKILTEQAIIADTDEILRPDKIILKKDSAVIIDFKTGIPKARDQKQVNRYKETLENMGMTNVQGFLFYTSTGELQATS